MIGEREGTSRHVYRLKGTGPREGTRHLGEIRDRETSADRNITCLVRRYRLAYTALLSLDPMGDWRKEYRELTDKDNRGPGKELDEQGVGDGRYTMSWIWSGSLGGVFHDPSEQEVNETVCHEWMTCRARADRWKEESELLQEEMRRVVAFLEWKSTWWSGKVGSRLGLVTADVQHGIDSYARRQADTYHELAVSLANQWLPWLRALGLDTVWSKVYSWTAEFIHPVVQFSPGSSNIHVNLSPSGPSSTGTASCEREGVVKPVDSDEDESDDGIGPGVDDECEIYDEGETSDGLGTGFEYDDGYMA
ncbi:hypothetical protein BJ322DRAFT_1011762 [Thelephora terrestris]|uniref:Uncharacterized protein n=1 Tax=Thelephora terrestris TaxID=56493 RepID=A0A9P6L3C9_9AGAM|nr:hypothetical protein BJ322DRAFT_1011762 [Thelephora terrestris]